ncbi:helix-turn-helix domain-containing protein [Rathayibacter sp. VKM Ac-2803]|uniref:helix-turn-helix domain-containing protein n=1 Tax=unclassified Rathayibacter TaxID=2609250 RepID=UPI00135AC46C|nr:MULTISPECIES: helix-turn-helix domain-containing protein [unclassified Rathayibacter]MWV48474.1 helix-turn-helix domain-containing protein [Rathayibacter sp. VKM Ac-2803]MWV60188.1 helix-turn-helix domain-containing protein [Rathayibacter sp. VKM Ac-2754]
MRTLEEQLQRRPVDRERVEGLVDDLRQRVRAARLRELRERLDLTQVELASELHISQNRVSQIERGDIDKSQVETLRRYVEALGGSLAIEVSFGDERYILA